MQLYLDQDLNTKGSKEHYLLGKNATCKFLESSPLSGYKATSVSSWSMNASSHSCLQFLCQDQQAGDCCAVASFFFMYWCLFVDRLWMFLCIRTWSTSNICTMRAGRGRKLTISLTSASALMSASSWCMTAGISNATASVAWKT